LVPIGLVVSEEKIFEKVYDVQRQPINMATVTKNRTYGKIVGFWIITQNPLIISGI
jgi:hypothetical protein